MKGTKQIIRAFECFGRKLLSGESKVQYTFHLVTVEATARGKAKKGKPFVHHLVSTVDAEDAISLLDQVRKLSRRVEDGELTEAQAAMTMPSDQSLLYVPTEMTFVVEAAAVKYMKRMITTDAKGQGGVAGDASVEALYEGPFSLEGLKGKASISPFNRDLVEVSDNVPLFNGDDDSFRQRRLRKRRAKAQATIAESKLAKGEVYVKAYHAGRKTRHSGPVTGRVINDRVIAGSGGYTDVMRAVKKAGLSEWSLGRVRCDGEAVTDNNSMTTVKTDYKVQCDHVAWFTTTGDLVGISEAVAPSIQDLVTPKL